LAAKQFNRAERKLRFTLAKHPGAGGGGPMGTNDKKNSWSPSIGGGEGFNRPQEQSRNKLSPHLPVIENQTRIKGDGSQEK